MAGVKQRPAPEALFPSLKQRDTSANGEEDIQAQYTAARAMFSSIAKPLPTKGS